MARPKLKGATIGIQLPLSLDDDVRRRALEEGLPVGVFLANLVCRAFVGAELEASVAPKAGHLASNTRTKEPRKDSREESPVPTTCAHHDRVTIGGGLARCRACGAMRDVHGRWKVVQ